MAKRRTKLKRSKRGRRWSARVTRESDALTIVWDAQKRAVKKRERDTLLAVSARVGAARINPMRLRTRSTVELVEVSE